MMPSKHERDREPRLCVSTAVGTAASIPKAQGLVHVRAVRYRKIRRTAGHLGLHAAVGRLMRAKLANKACKFLS